MKPDRIVLFPYKMGSAGGKLMAEALGVKRVYADRKFVPTSNDVVINWGSGFHPAWDWKVPVMLNKAKGVCLAVNKVETFHAFKEAGVQTPVWTQYRECALKWLAKKEMAVARTTVEGFDGAGIKLCKTPEELPEAQLYTKYVPISKEFRVYVFHDTLVDVLDKKRKIITKADPFIHTESLGWVFCQDPAWWPKEAEGEAIKAVKALGLDFGGVDVVWNEEMKKVFVLEVNTAPGVYGRTPEKYAKVMKQYIENL